MAATSPTSPTFLLLPEHGLGSSLALVPDSRSDSVSLEFSMPGDALFTNASDLETSNLNAAASNAERNIVQAQIQQEPVDAIVSNDTSQLTADSGPAADTQVLLPQPQTNNMIGQAMSFMCSDCGKEFSTAKKLVSHLENHCNCETCDLTFSSKLELSIHEQQCHAASSATSYGEIPVDHMTPSVPLSLGETMTAYVIKEQQHSAGEVLGKSSKSCCNYCGKEVNRIREHYARIHGIGELKANRVACQYCGKVMFAKSLVNHMRCVHGPKRSCPYCGVKVSQMALHVMYHHKKPKYTECPDCGKRIQFVCLHKHRRMHTVLPNQECPMCGLLFKEVPALKIHIRRVHDKVKQARCMVCSREFFDFNGLKRHMEAVHSHHKWEQADSRLKSRQTIEREHHLRDDTVDGGIKEVELVISVEDGENEWVHVDDAVAGPIAHEEVVADQGSVQESIPGEEEEDDFIMVGERQKLLPGEL